MNDHVVNVSDIPPDQDMPVEGPIDDGQRWDGPPPEGPDGPDYGRDVRTVEIQTVEDPREEIARNYVDKRNYDDAVSQEESQQEAVEQFEPSPDDQPPPIRTEWVKIDGREFEVPVEDLVRNYQMGTAAQRRLHEATMMRAEAERLLTMARQAPTKGDAQSAVQQPVQPPTSQVREPPTSQAEPSEQELMEAVERLQMGTTEEGAEALRKLMRRNAAPQQRPVDIGGLVERTIAAREDDSESTVAVQEFFEAFPQVASDEVSQGALVAAGRLEIMNDFVRKGLPEQGLRMLEPDQLIEMHRKARMHGVPGIRSPHEILQSIARQPRFGQFVADYGQQFPLAVNIDRSERKQMVQPQPALRSAPQQHFYPREMSQEEKHAQRVAEMRRERGLSAA